MKPKSSERTRLEKKVCDVLFEAPGDQVAEYLVRLVEQESRRAVRKFAKEAARAALRYDIPVETMEDKLAAETRNKVCRKVSADILALSRRNP